MPDPQRRVAFDGRAGVAAAGLVTDCQPSVGVPMRVMEPGAAATAPTLRHSAVTVISPAGGMVTLAGSSHCTRSPSSATPPEMVVPPCPTMRRSTDERVATPRARPLILTLLDSAAPEAVAGEKAL